ncbi:hypothetical protein [Paenibacillus nasutitermitis]|uniref:Phosphotyrosine protein phosphatase I domain-containing protein n=1 Tax=Paenibacillus nasutitermitis TaxID=1652958 RepID=A0A916ZL40_9BACL|nr:hypothetical protein [Paenibacillus nasutitermitis]GGE03048.1 hypothetical protein GCM10010911_72670 [Paenibacillus nasutitermitis]
MNIMFVCTDNFTRSVIAEFCMKDLGAPDSEDFVEQMKKLVHFFYEATPSIIHNLEQRATL